MPPVYLDNNATTPMDPRVLVEESMAVAKAAMDSGVARAPIADLDAYRERLTKMGDAIRQA